jgi:quinol monooxygenase YgiN
MPQAIRIVAFVESKPGREREVEAAIRAVVPPSRQDPGCLSYIAHREPGHDGRFVFVEQWASREDLSAHEKTLHFETLVKALEPLLAEPLKVHLLEELA